MRSNWQSKWGDKANETLQTIEVKFNKWENKIKKEDWIEGENKK